MRLLFFLSMITLFSSNVEVVEVSDKYTTHLIFPQEVTYTDLGQSTIMAATADGNENILRLKATKPFTDRTNISIILSDGTFITYYVVYKQEPEKLVYDQRTTETLLRPVTAVTEKQLKQDTISTDKALAEKVDTLSYLSSLERELTHIGIRRDKVEISVASIYIKESHTYITYSINNRSNLPVEIDGRIHTYKQNIKTKRAAYQSIEVHPQQVEELEPIDPGEKKSFTYLYEGLSLSSSQRITVNIYTMDNRTYSFTLSHDDLTHGLTMPKINK